MAITYNLNVDQGADFSQIFTLKDNSNNIRNLTGYTGRAQLRRSYASNSNVTFAVTLDVPAEGNVKISLTNAQTANLKYGRYLYDVELVYTPTGNVERIREGIVTINPEVTRL